MAERPPNAHPQSEDGRGGRIGVLVMAYGTPERPEDLEAYYTDIRRGRPPTPELLAELRARYDAIGGVSPLAALTRAQAAGVTNALDASHPRRFTVALGLKHAPPFVEDGVKQLLDREVRGIVGVVVAPHWSTMSIGQYHHRAEEAAGPTPYAGVRAWHTEPELIELLAERATIARASLGDGAAELLVTAHSLPVRAVEADRAAPAGAPGAAALPSYEEQLRETAGLVADAAGFDRWRIAFQSAGRTSDPWLGPDLLDVVRALPDEGVRSAVVCPAGFTSDHLEVLYDIDIEARSAADSAGIGLARTTSLNDDDRFCGLLARLVVEAAADLGPR